MANITLKVSRSDVFPVGTSVGAYPSTARIHGGKPAGSALATATVDAAGLLTLTVPAKTALQLWAEVASEHRYVRAGDPAREVRAVGLAPRVQRRRVESGALA